MTARRPRTRPIPAAARVQAATLAALVLLPVTPVAAQSLRVDDPVTEYLRVVQAAGEGWDASFTVLPFRGDVGADFSGAVDPWGIADRLAEPGRTASGFWSGHVQARLFAGFNSGFALGGNDGPLWRGKGVTGAVQGGASFGWGPVTVTLQPLVTWAQNSEFTLADPTGSASGDAAFRYPWVDLASGELRIDLPQRFGPDAYTRADLGESAIRVDLGPVTAGFGTEDLWWGPGVRNALVLSNTAGGFPKADLSTDGPVDIGIGTLEAQWIWGRIGHSDWWDESVVDRNRFFTGAVFAFSPDFLDGLTVGASRTFIRVLPEGRLNWRNYFKVFEPGSKSNFVEDDDLTGEDESDQLASVFLRWRAPGAGMEAWAEWARNDHPWDLRDLAVELGHSEAWIVGLRRVLTLEGDRLLSITGEVTHLETSSTQRVRDVLPWYTHFLVRQGYTSQGQLLGASVGPGGNSQFLGVDLWHDRGRWGGWLERRVHDNDAFFARAPVGGWRGNHVSLDFGGRGVVLTDLFDIELQLAVTRDLNRYFIEDNDAWNLGASAGLTWRLR